MDQLAALLAAIRAEPTDSLAWSALADHLEERGEGGRAELTRLTLRLALRLETPERFGWERRVWELLRAGVRPCVPEVVNSREMRLVLIPPGEFWMGSPDDEPGRGPDEGPVHRVEISRPFYLGAFPVTQAEYRAVMGENPSQFAHGFDGPTEHFPVDTVSWEEATEFCQRLSGLSAEVKAGRVYRLPTEAEWEYACRARTRSATYLGPWIHSREANYDGTYPSPAPAGPYLNRPARVGSYPPNGFGLFDMLGNILEWCSDWYDASWYHRSPVADPRGPAQGESGILRGGAWFFRGDACRSACRYAVPRISRNHYQGLRVVLD
jgi:uncharacterized protein (TIGR02996 family)